MRVFTEGRTKRMKLKFLLLCGALALHVLSVLASLHGKNAMLATLDDVRERVR